MVANLTTPLIVIVGPTATGKTELSLKLAEHFNGEIVSADSWLIRRGTDIGTAKPDPVQMQHVAHHMINIIGPQEDYTAALYKRHALEAIDSIANHGRQPFLVGGTGLYIDSVIYDYSFLPAATVETRRELNAMALKDLLERANSLDLPLSSIDTRNKRRVIRLIETNGALPKKQDLRRNTLIIGLQATKEQLTDRVAVRTDKMINSGLETEVYNLSKRYGWECEALKGIGYHEWRLYFEGTQSLDVTRQRIIKDTLLLAKRQTTWFKRNKSIHWFDTPVNYANVEGLITTFLNKNIP